jgi:hypothetical protein
VKQGLLKKGFLNPHSTATVTPKRDRIIPSSVEDNGFSQSCAWPVDFDLNKEIVVWEEDVDYWDGLPMEEDFQRDKMITRQKSKGKKELLNLQSSINYGNVEASFRRRKCKTHML